MLEKDIFHKINDKNDAWYKAFRDIYEVSFPVFEQRSEEQQLKAFDHMSYNLLIKTDNDTLVSFISYWDFAEYVYIEHLAVNAQMRGMNEGSKMLNDFAKIIGKMILLEIDPPINEIAKKRLSFYERLGYKTNPYKHLHPPYNKDYPPHELVVLSLNKEISQNQYNQFYNDLANVVMK